MAVRLLHAADIHIGMENYGRINPATGLSTRLEDFCATLDEAVDFAIESSIDLVVLAGDIYKTRDPTPTHQREFARRVRRLTEAGIPVFIVPGNHDIPMAASRATSVDIFRTLQLPLVPDSSKRHIQQVRPGTTANRARYQSKVGELNFGLAATIELTKANDVIFEPCSLEAEYLAVRPGQKRCQQMARHSKPLVSSPRATKLSVQRQIIVNANCAARDIQAVRACRR